LLSDIELIIEGVFHVYILTNKYNTVLYPGVTSDIYNRVLEPTNKIYPGFTSKYNIHKLVYYEGFEDINKSIAREKQINTGARQKKLDLINSMNANWEDLWEKEFGKDSMMNYLICLLNNNNIQNLRTFSV
jgi:putative endonuclease